MGKTLSWEFANVIARAITFFCLAPNVGCLESCGFAWLSKAPVTFAKLSLAPLASPAFFPASAFSSLLYLSDNGGEAKGARLNLAKVKGAMLSIAENRAIELPPGWQIFVGGSGRRVIGY